VSERVLFEMRVVSSRGGEKGEGSEEFLPLTLAGVTDISWWLAQRQLAAEWRDAIGSLSSTTKIIQHSAYQGIIALGMKVVPYILRDLEQMPDHWFPALRAITGEDPVAPRGTRANGSDGRRVGQLGEGEWFQVVNKLNCSPRSSR
jgi:hypothetical protein